MYHKLKIDVYHSKRGGYIFVNEDQAASLIKADRIEEKGYEVNPDEKAAVVEDIQDPIIDAGDQDNDSDNSEVNPDEKAAGKPGRKPKVSSILNTLQ